MVLQGPRGSFPQSLRGKGFPHPLPFVAQRPSQQYSLFFRTGVTITSSMKPPLICQGRGRGLLFCVPSIPFAKWSSQFSASLLPHPRCSLLKSNEFHVAVRFGGFRFLFLVSFSHFCTTLLLEAFLSLRGWEVCFLPANPEP